MNTLLTFRDKLQKTAPKEIDYVYTRRVESKAGVYVYTHSAEDGQWRKYEVTYERAAKEDAEGFWKDIEDLYEGTAEDFGWAFCHASRYIEAAVNQAGYGREYSKAFQKWCGKAEDTGAWTLTTEQCIKAPAFAFHFLKEKLPSPDEEDWFSLYSINEPDPRKDLI